MTEGSNRARFEILRQVVHFLAGSGAFLLYYWPAWVILLLLAVGVGMVRLARWYGETRALPNPLYRPGEHIWRNGAVTYAVGVAIAVTLFPAQNAFLGWLLLAAGDSASTLTGTRWPIRRFSSSRSIGGAAGFASAAASAMLLGTLWWTGMLSPATAALLCITSVLCGLAELLVTGIDDNLFLPGLAAALSLAATAG